MGEGHQERAGRQQRDRFRRQGSGASAGWDARDNSLKTELELRNSGTPALQLEEEEEEEGTEMEEDGAGDASLVRYPVWVEHVNKDATAQDGQNSMMKMSFMHVAMSSDEVRCCSIAILSLPCHYLRRMVASADACGGMAVFCRVGLRDDCE